MSTKDARRHRALAAFVAAVLATAGIVAVTRSDGPEPVEVAAGGQAAPAPPPEPSSTSSSTTTAITVPPSTATTAPPASTTTRPRSTTRPTTATTQPPAASTLGPRNPGAVVFPYEAGRVSWEGVSNGVTLRVRIDTPAPRVGDPVRFSVEAETPDHACCGLYLLYGDGGSSDGQMVWSGGCANAVPGKATAEYTHVYNRAGRWEFSFQAATGRCGVDNIYTSLHGYLEVAPGASRSQGPAAPVVNRVLEARAPNDAVVPGSLKVWAEAEDDDGFVSAFVVDFGDGTPAETFLGDRMGCRPTLSGWPSHSLAWLRDPYAVHSYAAPGSYTITVTAVSTGCDGGERQTATGTMGYVW